ncbi:aminoglycoside 6'-N-acetyltransferase [Devosia sp. FJ2-5-3]|jgi:aminoglycoside 6'-N-acetyltransferase I|uniref:aminoglycoside 6'-N-acetyltransferase n=1 Tax=Devosia sp. FJ2-5-3 TaxID=2976680 RepID=UPI0023D84EB9|nr:aminoglycoside 6'-N-acetyltransferase [Devosia sp. FJ2-5-3]WEJ59067.1 GNAT family N-acetyltransferase [Devosia sp. FJ2-5-3]
MDGADHLGQPVTTIRNCTLADVDEWAALRLELWPKGSIAEYRAENIAALAEPDKLLNLLARDAAGKAIGFAEAAIRHDYVNGCKTSPVGFLEGIYVDPEYRRRSVARDLIAGVEAWTIERGCTELASDAALDNIRSHQMHNALGFAETQRAVFFRKVLA